jgi:hyaluronate lyase
MTTQSRQINLPSQFRKIVMAWTIALFFLLTLAMSSRADQFDTLRLYWQNYLISNGGSPSSIASTANSDWSSMETSPTRTELWSDLPFGSVSANIVSTYQRLEAMALAWATPGSSLQGNTSLAAAVAGGLDWMNTNVYTTSATEYNNWFHWEISGPQALNNTAVLLYPALTGTQITNYNNAVDHYSPVGYPTNGATFGWMTGANTSDKVLVVAIRAILGKNSSLMTSAQANLSPVFLYVTSGDGFYTDGSFVFHSNIAYNGHYGLVLLGDIPTIVDLLQGSAWQITDPNLTNVYNWAINSFEPLVYDGVMMDMVRGRIVSWSYETESQDGSSTISAIQKIAQFAPPATAMTLSNWASSPHVPFGQYHFPSMDRVVALRSGFGFGISMSSTRIANYESINSGNLHGWHQGDGMTYLYNGSTENQFNSDFWPTVDPYHLPGTTVETNSLSNSANEARTTSQNWVGGAQVANTYGVAGMSLAAVSTTLVAKKSWFMFDNEIVCLGAGITCGDTNGVQTTAENRRLGSPITSSFTLNGTAITPTVGWSSNLPSATPSWCALGGTGGYYFPAGNSNLQATFVANSGSWSQINSGDSSTVNTDNYLKLWFNHGLQPTNASYAYVILPNMTATSVSNYALNPDIVILTNTAGIQAVKKPALGVVAVNFWTNGVNSADLITVNNKSSVITLESSNSISVGISDPTQTNTSSITVTLNRSAAGVASADSGVTVVQLTPQIILSVNVNGSHGKTYQASFQFSSFAPAVAIIVPATNTVYLSSTNQTLLLSATASNTVPTNVMTTIWSQTGGPGTVTFGNSNMLTTTANFSANGTYGITFTANNGVVANAGLSVVVNSPIGAVTNGLLGWWKMDETGGATAFDSSGNGANATVNGGTFTAGYLSNALHLTSGTNNATFASVDAAQTTVAAWVRADSKGSSSFPRILVTPGYYINFRFDGSANNNALDFATTTTANGATADGEWLAPPGSINTNAWYHVAISYDKSSTANVPALYVNGVKMSLTTLTSPSVPPPSYAGTTYIGNRLDLTRGWDGLIDDLRIYNRLLSDAEVQSLAGVAAPNFAPTVSAGANQTVLWPAAANLNGTVTDDGNPNPPGAVTVTWSEVSGPGTITFASSNALATTANFSAAGNYQLQLAANDGQVTTVSSVTVAAIIQPNLSFQLLSGALQLSWPASNGNWQLQSQTNLSATNWQNLPGTITNPFVAPIDPAAGSVFYRLLLMTN